MKILVVDDSATMRKIIVKAVKDAGFSVEFVEAADGLDGLEQLAKHEVVLVLSDVNMPRMDGIQFVRCVRDRKALAATAFGDKELIKRVANSVPIVMVTTEGGLDKIQEAMSAGANDYLKKPFTPAQLQEKIGKYLG
jgi:two-component system chemotaxis response regulator CheY